MDIKKKSTNKLAIVKWITELNKGETNGLEGKIELGKRIKWKTKKDWASYEHCCWTYTRSIYSKT